MRLYVCIINNKDNYLDKTYMHRWTQCLQQINEIAYDRRFCIIDFKK